MANPPDITEIEKWVEIALMLHEALPGIDEALSQANVPIANRPQSAFDIIQNGMLTVSDYKAFLVSDAHGRLRLIVQDWFRERYGESSSADDATDFEGMVMMHRTPFSFRVPKNFRTKSDQPDTVWIGFPASVQHEEDPTAWVVDKEVVTRLSTDELELLRTEANETANLLRSIGYDLNSLTYSSDPDVVDLAEAIRADLQACARHLCSESKGGLRSAEWDASQATEKAFKLFIRRKKTSPPFTHDLEKLASLAGELGAPPVDAVRLQQIPSNSDATNMRYGGPVQLSHAVAAYRAALIIVRDVVFASRPETKIDARNGRFLIKRPPWFDFDTEGFITELRIAMKQDADSKGDIKQ